ncbi:CPCC family cysteine-rich protein [Streptomyces erythrochromogenes]|uniref:CPCC family cysteine-rich protein n=1 Tax=Streptomyces erythrochromogenes TaxID=285574 RepID=UPI00386EA11C|nr:CPCC family cysteine-rich protein [Streptomyces erythrochromogenes]WSR88177.1 CPCC family cysteine-rich protein [Streptomyces erythrochromogenes]
MDTRRPCPCCGHLVFDTEDGWPGSYAVCPVCSWQDDPEQFRRPFLPRGMNQVSLVEAQLNFRAYEACDQRGRRFARPAADDEPLDAAWRSIDPATDFFEDSGDFGDSGLRPWPEDGAVLCWWLPSFWGVPEDPAHDPARQVVIDVGPVRSERDLHEALERELGFPAFYGRNWDAFWDAITGLVAMPAHLRFTGWAELELREPSAAAVLRDQLEKYAQTAADFTVAYDRRRGTL